MSFMTESQQSSSGVFLVTLFGVGRNYTDVTPRKLESVEAILDPVPFPPETLPHYKGGHLMVLFSPPSKESLSWPCHTEASCSLGSVEESPYFTKDHLGDYQRREAAHALKMSGLCPNLPSSREMDVQFRDRSHWGGSKKI